MRFRQRRTFERSDRSLMYVAICRSDGEVLECRDLVTLFQVIAKQTCWRLEHGLQPQTWIIGEQGAV